MSSAAWAALHPGTAAINATGGDMSSAAYAAQQQPGRRGERPRPTPT